ncbi:hypothetical protein CLV84_3847 [Neolewinella xylanilytica]|uniref:Uncharacterized protein n=1 Tax=Neolewinella xylanilytica TaxID=1514080 RepID=A0A2S6I173_9BACT|nr:hypothetical protein [Neolewinella xylanilytica]PPK84685.1 hypothetical protein CLV84_3847 [Neolewinella xylanilytica]
MRTPFVQPLILFLLFGLPLTLFTQDAYAPGYLIDRNGKREEVQILQKDWRYNPSEIQIRRGNDQECISVPTEALREFSIPGKSRYVNFEVAIEKSSVSRTTRETTPPMQQVERVLLRVEVEGKAGMYSYLAPKVKKYFLSLDSGLPKQLVYTITRAPDGSISESRTFVRQLDRLLACDGNFSVPSELKYRIAELREVILDYNSCMEGGSRTVYENIPPATKPYRITLLQGIYRTDFKLIEREDNSVRVNSENRTVLRLGVEAEYVTPYAENMLSVLFRPSYYHFYASGYASAPEASQFVMDYSAFDLPLAVRYYRSVREDIKAYATGGIGVIVPFGELYENGQQVLKLKSRLSATADIGVRYRDQWSLAIGYEAQGNGLGGEALRSSTSGLQITTGYTLP